MHELALADALVTIACDNAAGGRVVRIEAKVGRLRQVVPDALIFAFELVSAGTPAEGAELALEEMPVRLACRSCGNETGVDSFPLACDRCGGVDVEVTAGEELLVDSLEIEREPDPVPAGRR